MRQAEGRHGRNLTAEERLHVLNGDFDLAILGLPGRQSLVVRVVRVVRVVHSAPTPGRVAAYGMTPGAWPGAGACSYA